MKYRPWAIGKHNREPGQGELKIDKYSSFRKLARAMRRGRVPPERQFIIEETEKRIQKRWLKYLNKGTREIANG